MTTPPIILCVDDDCDDLFFITASIQRVYSSVRTDVAHNGAEALDYLERAKERQHLPALILLDINMPLLNGKETLAQIKADPELSTIPVVLFTTSNLPSDRLFCAHYGIDMATKPNTLKEMEEVLRRVLYYAFHY